MNLKRSAKKWNWFVGLMMSLCLVLSLNSIVVAEEFGLGDIPLDEKTYQEYLQPYPEETLPASYDARNDGIVTPAKNQQSCGSCWAFASTGAMESHILKGGGPAYDLSEQQQNSCNTSMAGCCGGSSTAPQFWQTQGPIYESCGPYGDGGTSCPTSSNVACSTMSGCTQLTYRVTNWHTVTQTPEGFKTSLYTKGPSYWRFQVYSDFNTFWNTAASGSVYTNVSGTTDRGGHAVLLIGWNDSKGAYLCKNSWGATGGPQGDGTFWIAYSGHYNNLGFAMSNFDLTGGPTPTYDYCFKLGAWSDKIYLNLNGNTITGYDNIGPYPIAGLFGPQWGFYIDYAETSTLGGLFAFVTPYGEMMYVRFYKDGSIYDYGPLTLGSCDTDSEGDQPSSDPSSAGTLAADPGEVMESTMCLKFNLFCDKLYMEADYIASHGVLFGYDDDCDGNHYTSVGFVTGNNFMIYGDFADASTWGYFALGTVSGMGGNMYFVKLDGTTTSLDLYSAFSFVSCTGTESTGMPAISSLP